MKERAGCEVVHEGSWEIQRWNRELTLKCKLNCYMKPMKDPLGVSSSKGNQETTGGKEKILLTTVGIEPTTSGLDLPLLCRLSYEVGQRKSGTSPTFSVRPRSLLFCCLYINLKPQRWHHSIWVHGPCFSLLEVFGVNVSGFSALCCKFIVTIKTYLGPG